MMQLESMCLPTNPKHHIPLNGITNMILYTCSFFLLICACHQIAQALARVPTQSSIVQGSNFPSMTAQAMLCEMHEIKLFMDRQIAKGNNIAAIANAQAAQFINKVNMLPMLTSHDANSLVDAFDAAPFDAQHKADFASAIASKLSVAPAVHTSKLQRFNVDNYLTEKLWTDIGSPTVDIVVKSNMLANLYLGNGVFHASEPSYGRGAIILATHGLHNQNPDTDTLHNLVKDLKMLISSSRGDRPCPFPYLTMFPDNPFELPDARLTHVYGDSRPLPCPDNIKISLQRISKTKFLRASASGVQRDEQSSHVRVAEPRRSFEDAAMMLMQVMQRSMLPQGPALNIDASQPINSGAQRGAVQPPNLAIAGLARQMRGFVPRVPALRDVPHDPHQAASVEDAARAAQGDDQSQHGDHGTDDDHTHFQPSTSPMPSPVGPQPIEPTLQIDDPITLMRSAMSQGRAVAKEAANNDKATKRLALENGEQLVPFRKKSQRITDAACATSCAHGASPAPGTKKRPAASSPPAAPSQSKPQVAPPNKRPRVSLTLETVYYNGGKIRASKAKGGYRCFPTLSTNPSDRCFRWDDISTAAKTLAWNAALNHIDTTRMNEKK